MKKKKKTKLFSVTAADCIWDTFRGSGNGGQKKQKTSSGVRCTHEPSGAVGKSTEYREQTLNKKEAFLRMCHSPEFQSWLQLKVEAFDGNIEIQEHNERGDIVVRKLSGDEV